MLVCKHPRGRVLERCSCALCLCSDPSLSVRTERQDQVLDYVLVLRQVILQSVVKRLLL